MTKIRMQLLDNVFLTYVPADKFKTDFLSAQFIAPLRAETAGLNALLPAVLQRGTEQYPDMQRLGAALDGLYGATVEHSVRKRGENQLWGFVATCVDDAYLPDHAAVLEPLGDILGELICHPVLEDGRLKADYVLSERTNHIVQVFACFFTANLLRRLAHSLNHKRNRTLVLIGIGNGQRNALSVFVGTHNHKVTGTARTCNKRSLHNQLHHLF